MLLYYFYFFFFSSRRRHTRCLSDWSSDVCSSDLLTPAMGGTQRLAERAGSGRAREFVMTGEPYDAAKIGRASCRERVETTVVGGIVRKKAKRECTTSIKQAIRRIKLRGQRDSQHV